MTGSLVNEKLITHQTQPWLRSQLWDLTFIIAPAFVTAIVALIFKNQFENMPNLPLWAWVSFVLLVDVAHVYATLFRTYLDKSAFEKNRTLLMTVPLVCWAVGTLLYSSSGLLFWRVLAYLAVFHFVRQQYGFMMLYARKDSAAGKRFGMMDQLLIYLSTLYPLLFWHTNLPRNFSWFVEGDFVGAVPLIIANMCLAAYVVTGVLYLLKELILLKTTGYFNLPKNLILMGTALSWWVAIVAVNSDMSFTMVNVVSHGIPYMALVWLYHHANIRENCNDRILKSNTLGKPASSQLPDFVSTRDGDAVFAGKTKSVIQFCMAFAPAFVFFLVVLAYLEEGLWAGFVWREHLSIFGPFAMLPAITDKSLLAVLVPLLSLPQSTHYVLDGFIWRVRDRKSVWST